MKRGAILFFLVGVCLSGCSGDGSDSTRPQPSADADPPAASDGESRDGQSQDGASEADPDDLAVMGEDMAEEALQESMPIEMALDECGLDTGYPGDEFCILPPPADQGFQVHMGPDSYEEPDAIYMLEPGEEATRDFFDVSGNDEDVYFYFRQYRMRPGAHHTILRDESNGRRLSGSNNNQDHPVGGVVAPENQGVGIPLAANTTISFNHHAINVTDESLLQEDWTNFWYKDPDEVTEVTTLLYDPGNRQATVAAGADVVLGPYTCDIQSSGRLISFWGHRHANNVRFSAWRLRDGEYMQFYESYSWEEILWLEFTSLAENPVADRPKQQPGGHTGVLDLEPGDQLVHECHVINQTDNVLRFTNETYDGTMCIMIGDLVGTSCL